MPPLFSIFTPTHDGQFLDELWQSLQGQNCTDFEWVVVPNGNQAAEIEKKLTGFNDPRIKVFPKPKGIFDGPPSVGALKRLACERASGTLLLELDHDDWLCGSCLAKVRQAYESTGDGFIFSESIGLNLDGSVETYSKDYGWEQGTTMFRGRPVPVMRSFDVTPRSLSRIFWAPNHVRVWDRDTYWKAGGHDANLAVADDHDLMCRTYLVGAQFHAIHEVLYYQRRHRGSTAILQCRKIGELSESIGNRYLHDMIFEWCRRQNLPMLDLGGRLGCPKDKGFKSVDARPGGDYHLDVLSEAFDKAFPDNSIGCFRACDFLEHIPIPRTIELFNLLYRKLAPFGWLLTSTPSVTDSQGQIGLGAFQDPTHSSFWSANNFWYFTDRNYAKYCPEITCRFQDVRVLTRYPSDWHRQRQIPYVEADLMAVKAGRIPGLCKI